MPPWVDEFKKVNDKRVLWDLIKHRIRQASIKFGKEKARERRRKISEIESSLKQCEEDCSVCPSPANIERWEAAKEEHDQIYKRIFKGAIIRSRATWYEKGEKSNKYFLNLENYKRAKSTIPKVFSEDGFLISDPKRVLKQGPRSKFLSGGA